MRDVSFAYAAEFYSDRWVVDLCDRVRRPALKPGGFQVLLSAVLLACVCVAGCTLPYEQLALPSPATGPVNATSSITNVNPRGTPLGDPAAEGTGVNRVYQGSGQFTQAADAAAGSSGQSGYAGKRVGSDGSITLDLVGASIPEAAKAVLGDVLNVNYVISDKVKGTVTLKTSRPVNRDGLLEIFESVLATQGIALVVDGPVFRLMPREDALAEGRPLNTDTLSTPRPPGMSSEVVPLKYVSATEMERILRAMAPQAQINRVDTARNLLVLSGSRAELQSMIETVSVFDVDWMRGMSFGIFPVETSDVEAIAQELDKIFANDVESPSKGIVRFVPNARLKSVLVISKRPEYLKKAETWIRRIDMASEATEKRAYVYHVQHRPAQELADLLKKLYAPSGQTSRTTDTTLQQSITTGSTPAAQPAIAADQMRPLAPNEGRPQGAVPNTTAVTTATVAAPGEPTDADLAAAQASANGNPSGMLARPEPDDRNTGISIIADEGNNTVVVSARPAEIRRIKQILQQVDTLPAQVLLEATIAEVTLNDDLRFGLRWFFEKGGSEFRLTNSALGAIAPIFPGFSYFLNTPNVQVVLNALQGVTNVNVISSPSMMTLNNKKAVLQIGDEVPIATQQLQGVAAPGAPLINTISFRETGVILSITPRVADNGQVLLEIEQEVSDVKQTTTSGIDSPTIQQRRIKTTVSVNNGGSVVLAGLMQDRATRNNQQVPIVGDVPVLGNLFKNKTDTIARTELLIAITPHVVQDNGQLNMIASEFRDRLNLSTRPQRQTPPDHREQLDRLVR